MAALKRLVERGETGGKSVLDLVRVAPGHETAFGAAFGDDLRAGVVRDGSGWHELPAYDAHPMPVPVLAAQVTAPQALARRLSQVGIVTDAATGAALQPDLQPGQRLVTLAGDLFRWDGLRVMAGCMIESSLLITAAAQLAPLIDYADLDGHLLIARDPFLGVRLDPRARLVLPRAAGLGVRER